MHRVAPTVTITAETARDFLINLTNIDGNGVKESPIRRGVDRAVKQRPPWIFTTDGSLPI